MNFNYKVQQMKYKNMLIYYNGHKNNNLLH